MKPNRITFSVPLLKFEKNADKTGWTYIEVPEDLARQLHPGNKKSFRVKGRLDDFEIKGVSLLPTGKGSFIMAINATMRKGIAKKNGAMVKVSLSVDATIYQLNKDFVACMVDAPKAKIFFETLPPSHQNYFSKWIDEAKTDATKIKRIVQAIFGLENKMNYGQMIRYHQGKE